MHCLTMAQISGLEQQDNELTDIEPFMAHCDFVPDAGA